MSFEPSTIRPSAVRLSTVATSTRKAHRADFGTVLRAGVLRAGRVAEHGLQVAAPFVPAGAIVSAALAAGPDGAPVAPGLAGLAEASPRSVGVGPELVRSASGLSIGGPAPRTEPTSAGSQLQSVMDATTRMTELNASYNLRYLQLQQRIQADTRQFNLVSNVLKTKHDAAKNALNNIR